mmetsp:Transcript_27276/g.60374  ORF Transcript_27276/g.60374 Transcript_27276/m.60374 type:complete len:227 (-) Transcript_27276:88-768(-)
MVGNGISALPVLGIFHEREGLLKKVTKNSSRHPRRLVNAAEMQAPLAAQVFLWLFFVSWGLQGYFLQDFTKVRSTVLTIQVVAGGAEAPCLLAPPGHSDRGGRPVPRSPRSSLRRRRYSLLIPVTIAWQSQGRRLQSTHSKGCFLANPRWTVSGGCRRPGPALFHTLHCALGRRHGAVPTRGGHRAGRYGAARVSARGRSPRAGRPGLCSPPWTRRAGPVPRRNGP